MQRDSMRPSWKTTGAPLRGTAQRVETNDLLPLKGGYFNHTP